jgi:hypothetical protein
MNGYFDTSALFKLLLAEHGSAQVLTLWQRCDRALSTGLTYVESRAALAAAGRAGWVPGSEAPTLREEFEDVWGEVTVVAPEPPLLRFAGHLAERHALRGYDAVHLASALALDEQVVFASADSALCGAAEREGLALLVLDG